MSESAKQASESLNAHRQTSVLPSRRCAATASSCAAGIQATSAAATQNDFGQLRACLPECLSACVPAGLTVWGKDELRMARHAPVQSWAATAPTINAITIAAIATRKVIS